VFQFRPVGSGLADPCYQILYGSFPEIRPLFLGALLRATFVSFTPSGVFKKSHPPPLYRFPPSAYPPQWLEACSVLYTHHLPFPIFPPTRARHVKNLCFQDCIFFPFQNFIPPSPLHLKTRDDPSPFAGLHNTDPFRRQIVFLSLRALKDYALPKFLPPYSRVLSGLWIEDFVGLQTPHHLFLAKFGSACLPFRRPRRSDGSPRLSLSTYFRQLPRFCQDGPVFFFPYSFPTSPVAQMTTLRAFSLAPEICFFRWKLSFGPLLGVIMPGDL